MSESERFHDAVARFKRQLLSRMLRAHGGNRTRTACALGLQRTYLLRLIRDFGLATEVPAPRRPPAKRSPRVA